MSITYNKQGYAQTPNFQGFVVSYRIELGEKIQDIWSVTPTRCCRTGSAFCHNSPPVGSKIFVPSRNEMCVVTQVSATRRLESTFDDTVFPEE